jgi:hypothetical protein
MHCPYCGVEAKVSSARFCTACRTPFWDLTSPGECPPVPGPNVLNLRDSRGRSRIPNRFLTGIEVACVVGLAAALYLPALRGVPISGQDYFNLHAAILLLCSFLAWSNSKWSVIVSLGAGFAVTIALNLGENLVRQELVPPAHAVTETYKSSAANHPAHDAHPRTERNPG